MDAVVPDSAVSAPDNADTKPVAPTDDLNARIEKLLKGKIDSSETYGKRFHEEWRRNVEMRLGHLGRVSSFFSTSSVITEGDIQTELNPDWSLTKTKTANLYSQVPTVQITHENKQYAGAIPPFAKALNYELGEKRAHIATAMDECLNDAVNASGIAAMIVGYAARFDEVDVPAIDVSMFPPEQVQAAIQAGTLPMKKQPRVRDSKFFTTRISPVDILVPDYFTGSNFDDADFVGKRCQEPWAVAKNDLRLKDSDKERIIKSAGFDSEESLRTDGTEHDSLLDVKGVHYKDIYYWRHRFDPDEKSFKSIWRMVLVDGLEDPVIHEPWKGQQYDEQTGKYVGACRFPIRVLTLTYVSDNPIPPSDSAAGRPQVNDLRRSRNQMFMQRERSRPMRWYDVNRVDPLVQETIMRGTWGAAIPTNGDGSRAIGEIARASYPNEDLTFDRMTKMDLMESWQIGPNQVGNFGSGETTARETETVQANFATRIGQERARVANFFLSAAEVLAGLMVLYSDFPILSDQDRAQMEQAWDRKHILHDLVLKIRPDSAVMIDSETRIARLLRFLNMTAKSGFINPLPVITEIAELSGLDPSEVIVQPQPHEKEPNITYRMTGKDDLINPLVMALLVKENQAPSPQHLETAKQILAAAQVAPVAPPQAPATAGPPMPQPPGSEPQPPMAAHPDWQLPDRISKRSRDAGTD